MEGHWNWFVMLVPADYDFVANATNYDETSLFSRLGVTGRKRSVNWHKVTFSLDAHSNTLA